MNLLNRLNALFHPEQYHGWGRNRRFFEGWYFKVVNAAEDRAFAFIPGTAMDKEGKGHAFIQVLDGKDQTSSYFTFPRSEFNSLPGIFDIRIGGSRFTTAAVELDLPGYSGKLEFEELKPWPSRWFSPGIMGPYAFVPFMECYHGVLSMDHIIRGGLDIQGKHTDFTSGRGYTEKDWGHSFPSAYIWMQTNHFGSPGISFKASVARIPWLGTSFTGFIAGLWLHEHLFQFTTYNGTKLEKSFADTGRVELVLGNPFFRVEIIVRRNESATLASPVGGLMEGRISESMTSGLWLRLTDIRNNRILFEDTGRNVALEVAGKIEEIMTEPVK
jgi:tocopherol cyclase